MVCRHGPNDPSCSNHPDNIHRRKAERDHRASLKKKWQAQTTEANDFEILELKRYKRCILLKVKYPSCKLCSFDGVKILLLPPITEMQLLKLRRIDPHFHDFTLEDYEAPSPMARFPATQAGWQLAIKVAESFYN